MKLKVTSPATGEVEFVYPDSMVCCDPADRGMSDGHAFRERPSVIFEILSPTTRRKDAFGKRTAYLAIPTLTEYIRIEQDRPEVVMDRRVGDVWQEERVQGLRAVIHLPGIGIDLPLADLYDGLDFPA
jgi:Uma2 family endonuclease